MVAVNGNSTTHVLFQFAELLDNRSRQFHCGCTCRCHHSSHCRTNGLQNRTEATEALLRFFSSLGGIVYFITHIVCVISALFQLLLHGIECRFRIVQLDLPVLGTAVIFSEGFCGIIQCLLQHFDFLLLGIDLFVQRTMLCCQCLCGIIILAELRLHQLHFATQHFEALVDVTQGFFEFLFAFQTDLKSKGICHLSHTSFLRCRRG